MKRSILAALACLLFATTSACVHHKNRDSGVVPENINAGFLAGDLEPEVWVNRFEVEAREIFARRDEIVAAVKLAPGDRIADVGAGTGLFVAPFAEAVGLKGKVYAIDISPRLIDHMKQRVADEGLTNVEVILSTEKSVELAEAAVDAVFVCDTYHHFEYYEAMLGSISSALRPGGQLIVIDFERIPGVSRSWTLGHVRAGKERFTSEIEQAGFRFVEEVEISGLQENYFLRFERP
jgi:ubiquinone/menaquinone biosynthesis C-methylase UbiE